MRFSKMTLIVTACLSIGFFFSGFNQPPASAYSADDGVIANAQSACYEQNPSKELLVLCALLELRLEANHLLKNG